MGLRFLVDHCISTNRSDPANARHEVVRLKEVRPPESTEAVVIAKAQEIDAILLSLNGDFADIATYPRLQRNRRNHPEIIPKLISRLTSYLELHRTKEHFQGKLLVVEVDRIRVRQ